MEKDRLKKISKSISYWLRHHPEDIGIEIASNGWTNVETLIEKAAVKVEFTFDELKHVVDTSDKKRFSLKKHHVLKGNDKYFIRANQGHSIDVELEFEEVIPPAILYHGAPVGVIDVIMKEGLSKMNRHHVHLSPDEKTAAVVGSRRGKFEILKIEAMRLRADGHKIYMSENGVYLIDSVPAEYIKR